MIFLLVSYSNYNFHISQQKERLQEVLKQVKKLTDNILWSITLDRVYIGKQ